MFNRATLVLCVFAGLASFSVQAQSILPTPSYQAPTALPLGQASATRSPVAQSGGWAEVLRSKASEMTQGTGQPVEGPAPARALKLGARGTDVLWLVNALTAKGYLDARPVYGATLSPSHLSGEEQMAVDDPQATEFSLEIEQAVRNFQNAHNLEEDGVAGNRLYAVLMQDDSRLGAALGSYANQVEQWANQAAAQGHDRMIVVNIPSYTLHAIDLVSGQEVMTSRVIVGSPRTKTPLMVTRIVNLKANPDWSPPPSIRARYQRPGPNNALGLMRFTTDNHQNIFLHDTNARQLFANEKRALSHGCVRVQDWHALAAWAARQDETWVDEVALAGGRTRYLSIDAIPVVITYSRVDMVDGKPQAYEDVYGRGNAAIGAAELDGRSDDSVRWLDFSKD